MIGEYFSKLKVALTGTFPRALKLRKIAKTTIHATDETQFIIP
jgi:hypothetical protein